MKNLFSLFIILICGTTGIQAQNIGVNASGAAPDKSAMLDVSSTTKGMLVPRMTTAQRTVIATPAKGLLVFDLDTNSFWFFNGTDWTQLIVSDNVWSVVGNGGINASTGFIGTTDNQPLRFRVNNQWAGEIHPITSNVFYGLLAGNSSMTGVANTAIGENTFVMNTTGQFNVSAGINSLSNNISGNYNTAIGERVLQFNTNNYNAGVGAESLRQNTSGSNNTAMGAVALYNNTLGFFNTAIGYGALLSNFVGTSLTALGTSADVTADYLSNATAIGYNARVDASDKVRIGDIYVKSIGGQVGWTTFSDGRYKSKIQEDIKGLEFIMKLRPVSYSINQEELDMYFNKTRISSPKPNIQYQSQKHSNANSVRQTGFLAQDVEIAMQQTGFNFSGLDAPADKNGLYGLRYDAFVVPIIKAMQEQQATIEKQKEEIEPMKKRLNALEAKH